MDNEPEELIGCELGTRSYWETRYRGEIANFRTHGDIGDVWFGEDCVERVCNWMNRCELIDKSSRITDLGCGNALVLIDLAKAGYTQLYGYDYSVAAIELAREIASNQDVDITFEVRDILKRDESIEEYFDVVHDKGTYDAISLDPNDPRSRREDYIANVASMLKADGLLVMTCCNWTESELAVQFKEHFDLFEVIPTAKFEFGGKVGSVVTSIVFKKKSATVS